MGFGFGSGCDCRCGVWGGVVTVGSWRYGWVVGGRVHAYEDSEMEFLA